MKNELLELLREINSKGHWVCFTTTHMMYKQFPEEPGYWMTVGIGPPDNDSITGKGDYLKANDLSSMIAKVEGWMIGMGYTQ